MNTLRFILGIAIILFIALPLVVSFGLGVPYGVYELVMYIFSGNMEKVKLIMSIISPIMCIGLTLLGVEFFRWGRHMTRATSREFV